MKTVAVAIVCKTPAAGASKTRLSPPLQPQECAALSGCFITDLSRTISESAADGIIVPYALYTPAGTESSLRALLPADHRLALQAEGDFGIRLLQGARDILAAGHDGVVLVNSDSPTLPVEILKQAADAVLRSDNVTLSPALDGGYTLIGLSRPHQQLFENIPWSTDQVYRLTVQRAADIGLATETIDGWYDVDDAASFQTLEDELAGKALSFTHLTGSAANATRQFVRDRQRRSMESI